MKKSCKTLIFILSIIFTTSSFADGPGWTVSSEVIKLVVTASGNINVRLSPELSGCLGYGGYGPKYATLYTSHAGFNSIHSSLLAAQMSGKRVSFYLSDDGCKIGEVTLGGTHSGPANN